MHSTFLYLPFDGLVSLYIVSTVFMDYHKVVLSQVTIIIREYLPGTQAGTRVGFVMMCTIMGMAIGGWMSGWIYDITGSYAAAFGTV